jgi:hypothetical protein
MVTGMFCGGGFMMQQQQSGGMGGAPGGVDCGPNPQNGDSCTVVGVCTNGTGCQCAAAAFEIYGCMDSGEAGDNGTGEAGGPGAGGSAGNTGAGGAGNAGSAGSATAGTAGGAGINCPANPTDGDPCTGGPGFCGQSNCYCSGPAGMIDCP